MKIAPIVVPVRPQRLRVWVQPRASRSAVVGWHAEELKICLAAPPVDNAANEELIDFVAGRLGIRRRDVRLVAGAASRHKVLEVSGVDSAAIAALLLPPE